nr:hypothetical protein [Tanacetum cinerariifolium]
MLAPGHYIQWKSIIKRYIDIKPNNELIYYCLQNPPYKFKWNEKTIPVAEVEVVQIILKEIDNDIYFIDNAYPNKCEMWKAIKRLKQCESINVQDLKTNLYWEFGKFTSRDGESLESYYSRFHKMMNELVRNQCDVTNHQVKSIVNSPTPTYDQEREMVIEDDALSKVKEIDKLMALISLSFKKIYKPTNNNLRTSSNTSRASQDNTLRINRGNGKSIVNSPTPTYDQEREMVIEDDALSKVKEIDKLMALISLSFKKIYKPTNNNLRTSSNTSRANQDNTLRINRGNGYDIQRVVNVVRAKDNVARECQKPKWAKDAAYHKEKILLCKQEETRFQLNADQADWTYDTYDEPKDQELETHYMYMAQIQEATPDAADNSEPIFDIEPLQKEQGDTNITIDSLDMSTNRETIDLDDDDDVANKRNLLASLIEKLKC